MSGGRPRTEIGTYGEISVSRRGDRYVARTRYRDQDGRLRAVTATASSRSAAVAELKLRLRDRRGYGPGSSLHEGSTFAELADRWLEDLSSREIAESTKNNYRNDLRLHVLPVFREFVLDEITTGRVEWFLRRETHVSYSRAKHSKNLLNLLFAYALRQDAIEVNPVKGTSPLKGPRMTPEPLTLEQIAAIRAAAVTWRTGEGVKGPRPDGQVRDVVEVLLGTGLRIGEALALRGRDIEELPEGMVMHIRGTIVMTNTGRAIRQDHPKTAYSIRSIAVPEFVADVLRARLESVDDPERTIFVNGKGGPLSPDGVRRTFRGILKWAGFDEIGITLRSFRRTVAAILVRDVGKEAAAAYLGHSSAATVETHYTRTAHAAAPALAAPIQAAFRTSASE